MANPTSGNEIDQWFEAFNDSLIEEFVVIASKIGEDATAIARKEHLYITRTGNLQSSCGFGVSVGEKKVSGSDFVPEVNGAEGSKKGKTYLKECLKETPRDDISLVLVAGMGYSGCVEDKGLDVLKSAEAYIRNEFDKLIKGLI